MTTRFLDSFEQYTSLSQKYEATSGTVAISSTSGRFATNGVSLTTGSLSSGTYLQKTFDNQITWVVGVAWYPYSRSLADTSNFNSSDIFMGVLDAGGFQVKLVPLSDGRLLVGNSNGTLGISTRTFTLETWQYVELKVTIGNSGNFEVHVDGSAWISGSGDTDFTGNGTANQVRLGSACNPNMDDIYILDGDRNGIDMFHNDFWGDMRILSLVPNQDSVTGWTPSSGSTHYILVDEIPPSITDYIESETNVAGPDDMFYFPDIDEFLGGVNAAQINAYAQLIEGSDRFLHFRVSAAIHQGAAALGTTKYLHYAYDADPTTPVFLGEPQDPWTATTINSNSFGFRFN